MRIGPAGCDCNSMDRGFATAIMNLEETGGKRPEPHPAPLSYWLFWRPRKRGMLIEAPSSSSLPVGSAGAGLGRERLVMRSNSVLPPPTGRAGAGGTGAAWTGAGWTGADWAA